METLEETKLFEEEWKEFESNIWVSTHGNLRRKAKNGELVDKNSYFNNCGYRCFTYQCHETKKIKSKTVHSVVALLYIGTRPAGLEIDHIDNDKTNNHYTNLQYVTRDQNMAKTPAFLRIAAEGRTPKQIKKAQYAKAWIQKNKPAWNAIIRKSVKRRNMLDTEFRRLAAILI